MKINKDWSDKKQDRSKTLESSASSTKFSIPNIKKIDSNMKLKKKLEDMILTC